MLKKLLSSFKIDNSVSVFVCDSEKNKSAGEKILEDNIKLKRQIANVEQKQSNFFQSVCVLNVASCLETFELYMENQVKKLDSMNNLDKSEEMVSVSQIIEKLQITLKKLQKENEELLSRKGKIFKQTILVHKAKFLFWFA